MKARKGQGWRASKFGSCRSPDGQADDNAQGWQAVTVSGPHGKSKRHPYRHAVHADNFFRGSSGRQHVLAGVLGLVGGNERWICAALTQHESFPLHDRPDGSSSCPAWRRAAEVVGRFFWPGREPLASGRARPCGSSAPDARNGSRTLRGPQRTLRPPRSSAESICKDRLNKTGRPLSSTRGCWLPSSRLRARARA